MPIISPVWSTRKMAKLDGRQVRCTTFDQGSVWIHGLDRLPAAVRKRLANSRYNLCPTCIDVDAHSNSSTPSLVLYFAVIDAIERTLDRAEQLYNRGDS